MIAAALAWSLAAKYSLIYVEPPNFSSPTVVAKEILLILISDSLEKALQYDSALRESKYLKDTNILYPDEFRREAALAEEKKQRGMAESCIIRIYHSKDIIKTYQDAEKIFREMDIWGIDEKENLYVLLCNTSEQDAENVLVRLSQSGIKAEKMEGFK